MIPRRRRAVLTAVLAGALLAAAGATARTSGPVADPGLSSNRVLLGGTVPRSGVAAAFGAIGPSALAYFRYVNGRGGVNGRKIEYTFYDDGYDPSRTIELTRKLVEQDRVFAIFSPVGTANNLAIQPYLNARKVPQLFVGDGTTALIRPDKYPWTMGYIPSYRGEGAVYGRTLVKISRRATVAVLFENTDFGKDLVRGLDSAIKGKGPRIVGRASYEFTDSDVSSAVARLRASRADTFMIFATPKFTIQAYIAAHKLGWRPRIFVASVSIEPTIMATARGAAPELTKGSLSIAYVKNPNDPIWARDPGNKLYLEVMRRYYPSGRVSDVYNWYGMTVAWTMVETLRKAGPNLTRAGLLRAAQRLDSTGNPFLLPGIRVKTSATNYFPIRRVYLYRYDNRQWVRSGPLVDAR